RARRARRRPGPPARDDPPALDPPLRPARDAVWGLLRELLLRGLAVPGRRGGSDRVAAVTGRRRPGRADPRRAPAAGRLTGGRRLHARGAPVPARDRRDATSHV